jgi:hypothetical protein
MSTGFLKYQYPYWRQAGRSQSFEGGDHTTTGISDKRGPRGIAWRGSGL